MELCLACLVAAWTVEYFCIPVLASLCRVLTGGHGGTFHLNSRMFCFSLFSPILLDHFFGSVERTNISAGPRFDIVPSVNAIIATIAMIIDIGCISVCAYLWCYLLFWYGSQSSGFLPLLLGALAVFTAVVLAALKVRNTEL
jgi:hypothetical protein